MHARPDHLPPPDWTGLCDLRVAVPGGLTTVHAAAWPVDAISPRLVRIDPPQPLGDYCEEHGITDAISGGFFEKSQWIPMGEHRIDGEPIEFAPFDERWAPRRPTLSFDGEVRIARRCDLAAEPSGDLLQAGPMLVRAALPVVPARDDADPDGFSSEQEKFDEDITKGRLPRAAVGTGHGRLIAAVAQGRAPDEDGLTLRELADVLIQLGAVDAMNLDGGSSACLVADGDVRNTPREDDGTEIPHGRPAPTGIVLRSSR